MESARAAHSLAATGDYQALYGRFYQQGEVERLRGELDAAEASFREHAATPATWQRKFRGRLRQGAPDGCLTPCPHGLVPESPGQASGQPLGDHRVEEENGGRGRHNAYEVEQ